MSMPSYIVPNTGLDRTVPQLTRDVGAEHAHAAVELIGAFVHPARQQRVVNPPAQPQLAGAEHRIDARRPGAGRDGGRGNRDAPLRRDGLAAERRR